MDRLMVLNAFVRVVEQGSFTRAADSLGVKQSTVSKWLASLEDELGVRLLDRTTRAQRPTAAGERLVAQAGDILAAYERAIADVRRASPELRGLIRMSVPVVFGRRFVVPVIRKFLEDHPQIEARLVFSDRYVSLVEDGFDLAVRVGSAVDSSLRAHHLGTTRRRLVAAPSYLAKRGRPEEVTDLTKHECIVHTKSGTHARWEFVEGKRARTASVRGRVSADHSEAALELVEAGLGIGLLASWLVEEGLKDGRLVPLLSGCEPKPAPMMALTPPGRFTRAPVLALIERLREIDVS